MSVADVIQYGALGLHVLVLFGFFILAKTYVPQWIAAMMALAKALGELTAKVDVTHDRSGDAADAAKEAASHAQRTTLFLSTSGEQKAAVTGPKSSRMRPTEA